MEIKLKQILSLMALFGICICLLVIVVFATTVQVLDGQVSVADTANSNTVSNGVVTIKAAGSIISKKTNTITITNETTNKAQLSFSYAASTHNSFTIAGATAAASGNYSVILEAGGTVTLVLVSNSGLSNRTATLTLSSFSLTPVAEKSNVTIEYDSALGSVTAGGSAVTSGTTLEEVSGTTGIALVATPKSGATFLGWIDADTHERLSADANYTFTPASDMTVNAVFVNSNSNAWFKVGNNMFDDLNDAATHANNSSDKVIIPMHDGTLPAGNYTVPSGVTLLIPFDSANTLYTTEPADAGYNTYTKPTIYRTLTLASGANITVNGAVSVGGKMSPKMGYSGAPSGPLGCISMKSGSTMSFNSGSNLYCWGVVSGAGSVVMNSGSNVYQNFQFTDYRGGSYTSGILNNEEKVFPLSQYYMQSVEVPITFYSGATMYGRTSIGYKIFSGAVSSNTFPLVGNGGLFQLSNGHLIIDYDESTDRLVTDIHGDMKLSNIAMSLVLMGVEADIDSSKYVLPLQNNMTINIHSGTTEIVYDVALLPGAQVRIEDGATVSISNGASFYIYDSTEWCVAATYEGYVWSDRDFRPIVWANGKKYTRTAADLVDAKIVVNGTLDATAGNLYTTNSGAAVISEANGVVKLTAGTATETYQIQQSAEQFASIAISSAQLQNGNGSYVATANSTTTPNTYTYIDGFWRCTTHTYDAGVVTPPTATEQGYTTYTCAVCGHSYKDNYTDATGATYSVTITWEQTATAVYTPAQTTYKWSPADLKYTASTTPGSWNSTKSVMTITVDNTKSTGAVTASFAYTGTVEATQTWTGLTDNALDVEAGKTGSASLTLTPTGTPTAPTGDSKEIILGTITITLSKEANSP